MNLASVKNVSKRAPAAAPVGARTITQDADALTARLKILIDTFQGPQKTLRRFSRSEAARFIGIPDERLGEAKSFSAEDIRAARLKLAQRRKGLLPNRAPGTPPQVIAVANFKGGSGKTTTTVHLAQHLALRGFNTLAIDLDPQNSLTSFFCEGAALTPHATLYGAIRYEDPLPLKSLVRRTHVPGLSLIPANLELQEFEHETPRALMAKSGGAPFYARIAKALSEVDPGTDVIVLDCPPQLGFLTLGALCAATGVLITVHPQMLDVASMAQFLTMMADLMGVVEQAGAPVALDFVSYVLTRSEPSDGPQANVAAFLRGVFGERVLQNAMVKSTAIADAGLSHQTLYETSREDFARTTYDRAMASLLAVNGEIEGMIRAVFDARPALEAAQ